MRSSTLPLARRRLERVVAGDRAGQGDFRRSGRGAHGAASSRSARRRRSTRRRTCASTAAASRSRTAPAACCSISAASRAGAVAQLVDAGDHPGIWIKPLADNGQLPAPPIAQARPRRRRLRRQGRRRARHVDAARHAAARSPIRTRPPGPPFRRACAPGSSARSGCSRPSSSCSSCSACCGGASARRTNSHGAVGLRSRAGRGSGRAPDPHAAAARRSQGAGRALERAAGRRHPVAQLGASRPIITRASPITSTCPSSS